MGSFSLGTNTVVVSLTQQVWKEPCGSLLPEEVALFQSHVHFSVLSSVRNLRAPFTRSYLTSLLQIAIPVFMVDRVWNL